MADKQSRGLSIEVEVDVSEALTGLKALQREAKEATRALREVENETYARRIRDAKELLGIQGNSGNYDYDHYMHGMYNGMECILAVIEGREPNYRDAPTEWLSDKERKGPHISE